MSEDHKDETPVTYKSSKLQGILFLVCFIGFIAALVLIDKYFVN